MVRGSVEETLNSPLDAEAEKLTQAARYERSEKRKGYRSGHHTRSLTTGAGNVKLQAPRLKGLPFETVIIERYRRRESSVEEALMEMHLADRLNGRGLDGVQRIVGDKCLGMPDTVGEVFPGAKYRRCTVHFYRNAFSVIPRGKLKTVSMKLKAIHCSESKEAALRKMKLKVPGRSFCAHACLRQIAACCRYSMGV